MKISEECLSNVISENSIHLMQVTSRQAINDLKRIYDEIDGKKHDLIIAVYGSLARYEMLPMSDIDVLLFANDSSIVNIAKEKIRQLQFDYIDFPSESFVKLDNLKQFALSNSPDGHIVKLCIVGGDSESEKYKEVVKIRDISNNPQLLLENLVFDYNYFNYRVQQKLNPLGENLKYSYGGTRDFVYFDWFSDFITSGNVSRKSRVKAIPQIQYSIPIICEYLGRKEEQEKLFNCINFVNTIKNQALLLKKQGGYFDGIMGLATARELLYNYDYENIPNELELIKLHTYARSIVFQYRQMLYNKIIEQLRLHSHNLEYCKHLVDIADIWSGNTEMRNEVIQNLLSNGRWSDVATVVCQESASSLNIDYAVSLAFQKPEYSHLLRIAIKHPNTSNQTLKRILYNHQIAGCEDIDRRYQKILNERLRWK